MDNYKGFANMYDSLMADTPYHQWGAYISTTLEKHLNPQDHPLVLDLACGTGTMTVFLAQKGYDMIGIDISEDMLATAQEKAYDANCQVLFLRQDMQKLDLYGTIDAAICVCDGLNYILDPQTLQKVFQRVKLFLNPGGLFIFDMNTEYKFKALLGNRSFEGQGTNNMAYEMDNTYDPTTQINSYHVCFHQNGKPSFTETHKQKAYTIKTITQMLETVGFTHIQANHAYTNTPPTPTSDRVSFIAHNPQV